MRLLLVPVWASQSLQESITTADLAAGKSAADASGTLTRLLGLSPTQLQAVNRMLERSPAKRLPPRLKGNPRALLQSAFVRLHDYMFQQGMLPLSRWGYGRRNLSFDNSVLSRAGFISFIQQHAPKVSSLASAACAGAWPCTRTGTHMHRAGEPQRNLPRMGPPHVRTQACAEL